MPDRLQIVQADITTLAVDAIVNAANSSLLGGAGVDGAIHRAAGPCLLEACRQIGGCPTGEARLTPGFDLPATWVIHSVGPVWHGGGESENELLASCYRQSLALATKAGARTIAFPAISTGAYGFPMERAASIAITEILAYLAEHPEMTSVVIAVRDEEAYAVHRQALDTDPAVANSQQPTANCQQPIARELGRTGSCDPVPEGGRETASLRATR